MAIAIILLSLFLLLAGAAGSVLPFVPGPPLSFFGLVIYAFFTHFEKVSITALIVFGILTVATLILDFLAPTLGATGAKASKWGVVGSLVGAVLGVFAGPAGIIVGPFLGAFVGELLFVGNTRQALKAAWGSFLGFLFGTAVRVAVVISMLFYFVYALFK